MHLRAFLVFWFSFLCFSFFLLGKVFAFAPSLPKPSISKLPLRQPIGIRVLPSGFAHLPGASWSPLAPLPSALLLSRCRLGASWGPSFLVGRCNLCGGLVLDLDAERSLPLIDGYAARLHRAVLIWLRCLSLLLLSFRRPYAAWLLRSASYASPLTHSRCSNTDNFRATATAARFFAFFPPRAASRSPKRLRSESAPNFPKM